MAGAQIDICTHNCDRRFQSPDQKHSLKENRLKAIGKTSAGRHVFLVFTVREKKGKQYIRPISARYMHVKEVKHYEEENPGIQE